MYAGRHVDNVVRRLLVTEYGQRRYIVFAEHRKWRFVVGSVCNKLKFVWNNCVCFVSIHCQGTRLTSNARNRTKRCLELQAIINKKSGVCHFHAKRRTCLLAWAGDTDRTLYMQVF